MIHRRVFWPGAVAASALCALFVLMCALALSNLSGCVTSPVSTAQTLEQRAYALYGTFVILEEEAARITQNAATPVAVRQAIRQADANAKPSADALVHALEDYQLARASPGSSTDRLNTTAADLTQGITRTQNDLNALVTAVKTP